MANQDAPFGLRPVKSSLSSQRQNRYRIASGYDTSIFQGDLVTVATNGTITRVAPGATALCLGVFNGCEYVDANGDVKFSNHWPAEATGTNIFANIIDDPSATFEVQGNAAFPVTDLFGNFDIVDNSPVGRTASGVSSMELAVSTGATTAGLALKAIDISQDPENSDTATANTNVIVKINNHLFSAGTAGLA
tara:strand:- start:112 stop:687 length:576 start_codon:yes stop_codon:yes gene_type:complete